MNESSAESPRWPLSYPDFLDWQRLNKSFSSLDVYGGAGYLLRTPSGAEPVQGERVSGRLFQTLGVQPMLGRDFNPGEDRPGGPNVVLLSYGAWLHRFGGRRNAVGQTVDLDNAAYTIIGVLPRSFSFAPSGNAEFWVPLNTFSPHEHSRTFYNFLGVGRLRDGVTVQDGASRNDGDRKATPAAICASPGLDLSASVVPLSEIIVGDVRPILLTLLGGAGAAVADRMRQCGQPGAGAFGEPQARDCRERRAGRHAGAAGVAVCDRRALACRIRQCGRRDRCRRVDAVCLRAWFPRIWRRTCRFWEAWA